MIAPVFEVVEVDGTGRGAVATEALRPGTLVHREVAFALHIDRAHRGGYGALSLAPVAEIHVEADGFLYLNPDLRDQDGPLRLLGGAAFDALGAVAAEIGVGEAVLGLALRMVLRAKVPRLGADDGAALTALEAPTELVSDEGMTALRAAARVLSERLPDDVADEDALVHGWLVANANGFAFAGPNDPTERVALGLAPGAAVFNHSCFPNCVISNLGATLEVRVVRPVSVGAELTVAYVGMYETPEARRAELRNTRGFECACFKCRGEPADAVEAAAVESEAALGEVLGEGARPDGLRAATAALVDGLEGYVDTALDWEGTHARLEAALAKLETHVGPRHPMVLRLLGPVLNVADARGDYATKVRTARRMLHMVIQAVPRYHVVAGELYLALAVGLEQFAGTHTLDDESQAALRREVAWAHEQRCAAYVVCCGAEHPATREAGRQLAVARRACQAPGAEPS